MVIPIALTILCTVLIIALELADFDGHEAVVLVALVPVVLICWIWYDCGAEVGYSEEKLTELGYGEYYLDDNNEKQWRFHEGTPVEENEDGS